MAIRRHYTCYIIGAVLGLCLLGVPVVIIVLHLDLIPGLSKAPLLRAHAFCGAFGLLGASIVTLRRYYQALITEDMGPPADGQHRPIVWGFGWLVYYISRPVLGAILGALVYMLSFIGLQVMVAADRIDISTEGAMLMYGIAFVAGYGVSNVMDRVEAISRNVFKPAPKDE